MQRLLRSDNKTCHFTLPCKAPSDYLEHKASGRKVDWVLQQVKTCGATWQLGVCLA